MSKVIIACSGAKHIAKKIAKKSKAAYFGLEIKKFPDNEIDIRFPKNIKGKDVFFVQSFYGSINEKIIETLFAAHTAKELGAKKIVLMALYFPYLRKDERFRPGECISAKVIVKLFSIFKKIYIVEPHLHRIRNLKKAFPNAKKISVAKDIADYIKKIKDPVFIGPDVESKQWVEAVAKFSRTMPLVLRKVRYAPRKVKIKFDKKIKLKKRNLVIIDDMISTGHTLLETIKHVKKLKPKRIYCIAAHGIFVEDALKKLRKYSKVITTNTIPSNAAKIDISTTIAKNVR